MMKISNSFASKWVRNWIEYYKHITSYVQEDKDLRLYTTLVCSVSGLD